GFSRGTDGGSALRAVTTRPHRCDAWDGNLLSATGVRRLEVGIWDFPGSQPPTSNLPQNRRAIATLTIVLARTPPLNSSASCNASPLSDDRRPVAGSLLNWIAGFVNDSMKPAGVPRTADGVASTCTRVVSGPASTRTSARRLHAGETSCRTPPPITATTDVDRVKRTATRSVSSIGTSPRI